MSSSGIAQSYDQSQQNALQGHCSQCLKVWTLAEPQGVCQWCGKSATCHQVSALPADTQLIYRYVAKTSRVCSRRRKRKQNTGIGSGYDQLPEPDLTYYKVALPFARSVPTQDSEDLLHTIIMTLADVERSNGDKPFTEAAMYRIASYTKADYWRTQYKLNSGLTCCNCSKAQRRKCKDDDLYTQCPKAVKVESLNKPIIDSEGNITELGELIADDKALDLDAWVDSRTFWHGAPERLKRIAYKLDKGEALTKAEHSYLERFRKREQKRLF